MLGRIFEVGCADPDARDVRDVRKVKGTLRSDRDLRWEVVY
jgi:hypothetical protein